MKSLIKNCIIMITMFSLPLLATTRYVSKSGNNIPPYNTEVNASTNIENALNVAIPNDVIQILDNHIYNETLTLQKDGITIKGAPNNKPILQNFSSEALMIITNNNIQLKNLILNNFGNSNSAMIKFIPTSPHSIFVSNCAFKGTNTQYGFASGPGTKTIVDNCSFSNFYMALSTFDLINIQIKNSIFQNNTFAITLFGISSNVTISHSKFYNIQDTAIYFTNLQTGNPIQIYKNYFSHIQTPIVIESLTNANFSIFNNTFYMSISYTFILQTSSLFTNITFDFINNIVDNSYQTIGYFQNTSSQTIIFHHYNNCYNDPYAQIAYNANVSQIDQQNLIGQSPQLVAPENQNFTLKPSSPCIDKGKLMEIPFSGMAPDIGAYETLGLGDIYANFDREQIFSENNVEMNPSNLEQNETAHILIKNLFFDSTINPRDPIEDTLSLRIDIFSINGKHIITLFNGLVSQNILQFNLNMYTLNAPSGLYFLRIRSNTFDVTKKFTYVQ